jgi:hypothetical protein
LIINVHSRPFKYNTLRSSERNHLNVRLSLGVQRIQQHIMILSHILVAIHGHRLNLSIFISKNLLAIPMLDYFLHANSSVLSLFIAYGNEVS